jgi:hypothetical protein
MESANHKQALLRADTVTDKIAALLSQWDICVDAGGFVGVVFLALSHQCPAAEKRQD